VPTGFPERSQQRCIHRFVALEFKACPRLASKLDPWGIIARTALSHTPGIPGVRLLRLDPGEEKKISSMLLVPSHPMRRALRQVEVMLGPVLVVID